MWTIKPDERLRYWRQFRLKISENDLEKALNDTVNLWSYAPYVSHYLHPNDLSEWPDPWTLVHENYYCDIAKSLGMLYTLYLSDHWKKTIDNLELRIYSSPLDVLNTVWVNGGKYILNLEFNTIVNKSSITKDLHLQHRITVEQLKLENN
jgi:hypothetical protein